MGKLSLYGIAFLLGTVKFLFAASMVSASSLTPLEIALATGAGAFFSFNVFYWSAGYFMRRARRKNFEAIQKGTYNPKRSFSRINRIMVKTKMSKSGFWVICTLAPIFLSIPIGTIIVAKFYHGWKWTYPVVTASILTWAFFLAYLNGFIFAYFR